MYKQYLSEFIKKTVEKMANSLRNAKKVNHFDGKFICTRHCTKCYNLDVERNILEQKGGLYMYRAKDIAIYTIHKSVMDETPITNLQLQKILYYIQGYFLKVENITAFNEPICNWPYGPVVPEVYFEYNIYGARPIEEDYRQSVETVDSTFNDNLHKSLIDKVVTACLKMSTRNLVEKTHTEDPWRLSKSRETIGVDAIKKYFTMNDPLGIVRKGR
ncbi:Panacea domain-containing protein [Anaerotruncus rubiinfantis]|uniref:Panacea domain-containing protein n=1 Tax=Anaerotruncus rubiinfantis TaxID=1720200 RepID=UPI0011C743B0|nr:type II toxin-antitoxin system antitoxin SocA domain-containing protein [Anaerotruncus rubiinfantis]